ncbi:MAG: hypothetical protein Q7S92_02135 [Candidatus Diapherotrites archaeon]|nr:hypothetical protein [Candidatus Diapherotrites archaeon]
MLKIKTRIHGILQPKGKHAKNLKKIIRRKGIQAFEQGQKQDHVVPIELAVHARAWSGLHAQRLKIQQLTARVSTKYALDALGISDTHTRLQIHEVIQTVIKANSETLFVENSLRIQGLFRKLLKQTNFPSLTGKRKTAFIYLVAQKFGKLREE